MATIDETLALCFQLKNAGYQPEAAVDPEAWNIQIESWPNVNDGYRWEHHPTKGWYPNAGRKALMAEIVKIIGQENFDAAYGTHENVHQDREHEAWMAEWLNAKKTSVKADNTTTENDQSNQVAPGVGSSEESPSAEV
jgi:hypothetical protein